MRAPPEVLAPAGGPEAMKAAVENGADAVYFGLERWNARERAHNFTLEGLPAVMRELRRRGVKGYVTFNTLVYESELDPAEEMLRGIAAAGADAIIVQDLGLARLAREVAPDLPVHASTQMTITDAAAAELARGLGVTRAVLARELSTAEIARIAAATPLELEVFVHGALCVSYSGQCFTSAAWGGRSANRGECAQACRLPYDLLVDGERRDLGPLRYLLSPLDLAGHDAVPALIEAGVVSFKIEGRLKQPEYVAATVQAYRSAIDRAASGEQDLLTADERAALAQVYSRGPSPGFLAGADHQRILDGTYPRHRGVRLGRVVRVDPARNAVLVALDEEVKRGDGLLLAGGDPEAPEPGGRAARLEVAGREVDRAPAGATAWVEFERRSCDVAEAPPAATVWRTSDPELERRLRASFEGEAPRRRARVDLRVEGRAGAPLVVTARDDQGHEARAATEAPLAPAARSPLDRDLLADKLGRLGGTPFELGEVEVRVEGACHVPVSELNRVRRELAAALEEARAAPPERPLAAPGRARALLADRAHAPAAPAPGAAAPPVVVPLCRDDAHLEGALAAGAGEVYLEWMEMVGLRRAVERARAAGCGVGIVPPRIQKPGDERVLDACLRLEPDALLVRSLGALERLAQLAPDARPRLHGDFSLNAANALGARLLLDRGLTTFVPAYDLSFAELERLLADVDPGRAEVVVHQHIPMFHTEYCAYARLLSPALGLPGRSFEDCGRPCESHRLALQDRTGQAHPVLVDVGCRNTVFSGQPNSVADDVPRLLALGVRRFRVELLREDARQAEERVRGYADVAAGRRRGAEVRQRAGAARRLGVLRVE
ncbi:MAG: U32 family peptidase [Planctomycetes bacterium]|nr:U32 family peptidase [Planctomycetota bacterium]